MPSSVQRELISLTHFLFGAPALKSRASRSGATGRSCCEFVVALYFLAALARKFCRCIYRLPRFCARICAPDRADQEPDEVNLPASSGQ